MALACHTICIRISDGWDYDFSNLLQTRESADCKFRPTLLESIMLYRKAWEAIPENSLELFVVMLRARPQIEITFKLFRFSIGRVKVLDVEFFSEVGEPIP